MTTPFLFFPQELTAGKFPFGHDKYDKERGGKTAANLFRAS
jgi:hypothetical protein